MAIRILVSVAAGFVMWIVSFSMYYLPNSAHIVASMLVLPLVAGACFCAWGGTGFYGSLLLSAGATLTMHLIGMVRAIVAFLRTGPLVHVIGTLRALAYVLPIEVLAAALGCIIVLLVRRGHRV